MTKKDKAAPCLEINSNHKGEIIAYSISPSKENNRAIGDSLYIIIMPPLPHQWR